MSTMTPTYAAIAKADHWMTVVRVCIFVSCFLLWVVPPRGRYPGVKSVLRPTVLGEAGHGLDRKSQRKGRVERDRDGRPFEHHG